MSSALALFKNIFFSGDKDEREQQMFLRTFLIEKNDKSELPND